MQLPRPMELAPIYRGTFVVRSAMLVSVTLFLEQAGEMKPLVEVSIPSDSHLLGNPSVDYIVNFRSKNSVTLDCTGFYAKFAFILIDLLSGKVTRTTKPGKWGILFR